MVNLSIIIVDFDLLGIFSDVRHVVLLDLITLASSYAQDEVIKG